MRMNARAHAGARLATAGILAALLFVGRSLADHEVGAGPGPGGDPRVGARGGTPRGVEGLPPVIGVTPASLSFTLPNGGHDTGSLLIENTGGTDLIWSVGIERQFHVRRTPLPTRSCSSSTEPAGAGNYVSDPLAGWQRGCTAFGGGTPQILVYTDDGLRSPPFRHITLALQALGLPFTVFNDDPTGFGVALTSQSWDLVVVDHNGYYAVGTLWEALRAHLESGGKLLVTTFDVDGSHSSPTLLWDDIGAAPAGDLILTIPPVFRWNPAHPLFSYPESVPDFTAIQYAYLDNGDRLIVAPPSLAVGGFTETATYAEGAIVVSANYPAILNSFLLSDNGADLDADGKPDSMELYENEVVFLLTATEWLTVDPLEGVVRPGGTAELTVSVDATGLASGTHSAEITISSNDPAAPETVVPVSLDVQPAQDIAVSDTALTFGPIYAGGLQSRSLTISNRGEQRLTVGTLGLELFPFQTDWRGFTLEPGQRRTIDVTFHPEIKGTFDATIEIPSGDPDERLMTVTLTGVAVGAPEMTVTPHSFQEVLLAAQSVTSTLTPNTHGDGPLFFELSAQNADCSSPVSIGPQAGGTGSQSVGARGRSVLVNDLAPRRIGGPRTLVVRNVNAIVKTGAEPPSPSGSGIHLVGSHEEVFGSRETTFEGEFRSRGNIFHATRASRLPGHPSWLPPPPFTELWFLVYEGTSAAGTYTLVSASDATPAGPIEGWYSSGDINVPLLEDHYYLIIASFDLYSVYYNQTDIAPYPVPASFGELIAGAGWSWVPETSFPPLPPQTVLPDAFEIGR